MAESNVMFTGIKCPAGRHASDIEGNKLLSSRDVYRRAKSDKDTAEGSEDDMSES